MFAHLCWTWLLCISTKKLASGPRVKIILFISRLFQDENRTSRQSKIIAIDSLWIHGCNTTVLFELSGHLSSRYLTTKSLQSVLYFGWLGEIKMQLHNPSCGHIHSSKAKLYQHLKHFCWTTLSLFFMYSCFFKMILVRLGRLGWPLMAPSIIWEFNIWCLDFYIFIWCLWSNILIIFIYHSKWFYNTCHSCSDLIIEGNLGFSDFWSKFLKTYSDVRNSPWY